MTKRIISVILVVIMCFSLLPLQAIAANSYNPDSNANFTITVVNQNGDRIEKATVTVKRSNTEYTVQELGNGQYEFTRDRTTRLTRYTITVNADGYSEKSVTVYGNSTNTTITLTAEFADFRVYYIADGNVPDNGYSGWNEAVHYGPSGDDTPLVVMTVNLTLLKQIAAQPNSPVVYKTNSSAGNKYEFVPAGSHTDANFKENVRKFWDAVLTCIDEDSEIAFEETGLFDEYMGYCLKQQSDSSLHCDGILDVQPPVYVVELYQNNVYFGGGLTDSAADSKFLTAYDILDQYEAHLKQVITWVEDENGKPKLNAKGEYTGTYIDPEKNRIYEISVFQFDDSNSVAVEGSEIPYVKRTNTYYLAKFEMDVDDGTPLEYTVTYTDGVSSEYIFYNHEYAAKHDEPVPAFTGVTNREGHTFVGWYLEGSDAGAIYTDADIAQMKVTDNMVFHAVWQSIPDYVGTVKVVLDGTFDADTQTVTSGQLVDLETVLGAENVSVYVSKDGEEFIKLEHNGVGTYGSILENGAYTIYYSVDNGTNYVKASNQFLLMESNDRTRYLFYNSVVYDPNGGTLDGNSSEYTEYYVAGSSVNVYETAPHREGYAFVGWKSEDGTIYTSGELLDSSINAPYKLTAQWIEIFDVYLHVKLEHGSNNNDAMHNVIFTLDTREGNVGDFTEIYSKQILWDGLSDFNDDSYTCFYSTDGKYTEYTPLKANVTNVPKSNQYIITASKANYEVASITESYDENGDLHIYATLKFEPDISDFVFNVELDEEAKQLSPTLWPKAVNVKITAWYENTNDEAKENTWHSIIQHYETYERIELDAEGKGAGNYPVWAYQDNGEPYYYRIEIVSYELQDGSLVYAIDQDGEHVTYPCERKRYVANIVVDGGQDPDTTDDDALTGAWFENNEQQGTVKAIVSIPVYTVTFVPNGGTLNGSTDNKVLKEQIIVPDISKYQPVRDGGYLFEGWYLADDEGNMTDEIVISGSALTEDLTFIAKWKNPISINGVITVAATYTQQNGDGTTTLHTIHERDRIESIVLLLQKQTPNGYFESVAQSTLILNYGLDSNKNLVGAAPYSFNNLPDDGSTYRIEIVTANYNGAYQNEPNSVDLQHDYDSYNEKDFHALLGGDNVATVNAFLEFVPTSFDLEFVLDSTPIGEGFRPDNGEILITYDDGDASIVDPSQWTVISQMIFDDGYQGYDVILNGGIGNGIVPVWVSVYDGATIYNYGIRLQSTTTDGKLTLFGENPYFDVEYQAPAYFDKNTQAQNKQLIATLVPKTYSISYELNGGAIYGHHPHSHTWSYTTDLTDIVPYRDGYEFDGWYTDEAFTKPLTENAIDASVAEDVTFYAKWKKVNVHMQVIIDHTTDNNGLAGNYEKRIRAQLLSKFASSSDGFSPVEGELKEYDRSEWHTHGDNVAFDIIEVPYIFTNLSDDYDYNLDVTLDGYYIVDNYSNDDGSWKTGVEKVDTVDENGDHTVDHYVTVCLKYDPELLDITFSVEMADGVDKAFYPDYANVKITCWFDHPAEAIDLDWNVITQHTNDVIKVKLDENGNGKGYGVCAVWQWLSKEYAVPYYYRFEVVSLVLKDGTVVEMNEQQDEVFYTGGGYTSTIYADNGCKTPVVVDENGKEIEKYTSLLGSFGHLSNQSGPRYLQTGELRAVINMGSVVFHANNTDATCYDAASGNDVFRTYCNSDMPLPEGEYYNLNANGKIDEFYDIPEFDYYTHNNYVFKGWYTAPDESGEPIDWNTAYLTSDLTETVHVYAHWIQLGDVAKEDDGKKTGIDSYHEYDLMGVQIRDAKVDELGHYGVAGSGLRFITVLSESVYSQINAIKGNENGAEYGFVVAKSSTAEKYAGNTAGYTLQYKAENVNGVNTSDDYQYVQNMKCSGVVDHFNGEAYRLYTAVITYEGLEGKELTDAQNTNFVARSYIRYYDANGLLRTYYNNYTGNSHTYNSCDVSYSQAQQIMNAGE